MAAFFNAATLVSSVLRSDNRDALHAAIGEKTRTRPGHEWVEILNEAGVPTGPIYDVGETFNDAQVKGLGMDPSVDHPRLGRFRVVGQATKLTRTPDRMRAPTPEIGEHTDEVLTGLGYDTAAIADLHARDVI